MLLVTSIPHQPGWYPINHMVRLAAAAFGSEILDAKKLAGPSLVSRTLGMVARRDRKSSGAETCLLIGAAPTDLLQIYNVPGWRTRFRWIGAWVIDSFWTHWIPKSIRIAQPFDDFFITSKEDADAWKTALRVQPGWLPWGSDVLGLGSANPVRPWDLTRVGRQPPSWDDDDATGQAASGLGLRFHPRPPETPGDASENQRHLMQRYAQSKFLLAFSNSVNPTNYTHPTREYLTGRWVDALAGGAVVAGVAPRGADALLWPGATLELGGIDRAKGLATIARAAAAWTPQVAARNHAMALRRLDWRSRFQVIAKACGEQPAHLAEELRALQATIDSLDPAP